MEINDDNIDHHVQLEEEKEKDQEEAEEALSLSELPLSNDMLSKNITNSNRRSASEPPELFEFFSDLSSDNMCSAEDIICCGRLIPFREQSPLKFQLSDDFDKKEISGFRQRLESLSELQSSGVSRSRRGAKASMIMRNSRSLDHQKLRRGSNTSAVSPALDIERNPSTKSIWKPDVSPRKVARLRWSSFLMFGMVKFPAEMELGDIKSRQARRNVPITKTPFPLVDSNGNFPVSRSNSGKGGGGGGGHGHGSWRLLKALSCKDHASVAVTASFYVPHV